MFAVGGKTAVMIINYGICSGWASWGQPESRQPVVGGKGGGLSE